jgi:hypothetical protein
VENWHQQHNSHRQEFAIVLVEGTSCGRGHQSCFHFHLQRQNNTVLPGLKQKIKNEVMQTLLRKF